MIEEQVEPNDNGTYNFEDFGAVGDGVTDNYDALMRAFEVISVGPSLDARGPTLIIPDKTYFIGRSFEIKKRVSIKGVYEGSIQFGGPGFKFPPNVRGFTFNRRNTKDGEIEASPSGSSDGSSFENLLIDGTYASNNPLERNLNACGVRVKARVRMKNVRATNFSGDGFYIAAGATSTGDHHGNCNLWRMDDCHADFNGRHGLHVRGADANAGMCIGGNFRYNGAFGVRDMSFLGNTYIGGHTATNGVGVSGGNRGSGHPNGIRGGSQVNYQGTKYYAVYKPGVKTEQDPAQDIAYHIVAPGTDDTVWCPDGPAGRDTFYPEWQPNQPLGTYCLGGGYFMSNHNARTVVLSCYSESDEAGNIYAGNNILCLSGLQEKVRWGGLVRGANGDTIFGASLQGRSKSLRTTLGGEPNNGTFLAMTDPSVGVVRFRAKDGSFRMDDSNLNARVIFDVPGANSNSLMGTTTPQKYIMNIPTLAIGAGKHARRVTTGTSAPKTREWAKGDMVYNVNPVPGGYAGWICVVGGIPGEWKPFGKIEE